MAVQTPAFDFHPFLFNNIFATGHCQRKDFWTRWTFDLTPYICSYGKWSIAQEVDDATSQIDG